MPTPTLQQLACYEFVKTPKTGSLAIDAKAGAGKTFTLREIAKLLPGSGLATSFSKSTVSDLSAAMPSNWDCIGMHALGLRGIRQRLPNLKVDSTNFVLNEYIKEALTAEDEDWRQISDIRNLVELASLSGIVPNHNQYVLEDTPESWEQVADLYDLDISPLGFQIAHSALIKSNSLALKGNITFTHMLTLPVFWGFPVKQYPKIIVDEAQDLNVLQHLLVAKALRPGGRIVIAGDPNQAIFAFAGAMSDSFSHLTNRFKAHIHPLTVSWRCAKAIIGEAQQYVPSIEHAPTAPEGEVIPVSSTDIENIPKTIICRNNAPLLSLAIRLFLNGFSCEVAGKDIGAGLKSTINRLASGKNSDSMSSEKLVERLQKWADREISRRPAKRHNIEDKVSTIVALAEHLPTVKKIRDHIDSLYVDPTARERKPAEYHLTTIHKAKGREWDAIGLLDPHLLPAKWAKQSWELQQENNLTYVALTRARISLTYLDSKKIT